MNLSKRQLWMLPAILVLGGVIIGLGLGREFHPEPAVVEVHHTDTIVQFVEYGGEASLSIDGAEEDFGRDYGFDRIFPIYHYKITSVGRLCGAIYSEYNPLYGERECGFIYFDEDIKRSDMATMNIYQCYDTTYDTTCYKLKDCGGPR